MSENGNTSNSWKQAIETRVKQEVYVHGEVLPLWIKHPEIECYSIDWRMGEGETYAMVWSTWAGTKTKEEMIEYFSKYEPLPEEWCGWIAVKFGCESMEPSDRIQYLHDLGLAEHIESIPEE